MRNKRVRNTIIVTVICAVVACVLITAADLNAKKKDSPSAIAVSDDETDSSIGETVAETSNESTDSSAPEETTAENESGRAGLFGGIGSGNGIFGIFSSNNKNSSGNSSEKGKNVSSQTLSEISFPYTISGTDIVVEQISPYDGYFIEDGQDQEVSNVAAIVLTNKGDDADFVGIGISQGDRSLAFSASQIPAGASVIVLEQNKTSYNSDAPYYSCTANVTRKDDFNMNEDRIQIKQDDSGTFKVANISDESIPQVKVLFKNYLPEEDIYVGGITYTATLTDLEPGEETSVSPGHYDPKYSKFIEAIIE